MHDAVSRGNLKVADKSLGIFPGQVHTTPHYEQALPVLDLWASGQS